MTLPRGKPWPGDWALKGDCIGVPDLFYPEGESEGYQPMIQRAKKICAGCPVKVECREHALTSPEEHGIWGGLTEKERRMVRRSRYASANPSLRARGEMLTEEATA